MELNKARSENIIGASIQMPVIISGVLQRHTILCPYTNNTINLNLLFFILIFTSHVSIGFVGLKLHYFKTGGLRNCGCPLVFGQGNGSDKPMCGCGAVFDPLRDKKF